MHCGILLRFTLHVSISIIIQNNIDLNAMAKSKEKTAMYENDVHEIRLKISKDGVTPELRDQLRKASNRLSAHNTRQNAAKRLRHLKAQVKELKHKNYELERMLNSIWLREQGDQKNCFAADTYLKVLEASKTQSDTVAGFPNVLVSRPETTLYTKQQWEDDCGDFSSNESNTLTKSFHTDMSASDTDLDEQACDESA